MSTRVYVKGGLLTLIIPLIPLCVDTLHSDFKTGLFHHDPMTFSTFYPLYLKALRMLFLEKVLFSL